MSTPPPPSPQLFFSTAFAYRSSAALKAAVDLDLFTAIGEAGGAGTTAEALVARLRAAERGVRILCDFLTAAGFLVKQDGRYRLTPDSAVFLDRGSPACLSSVVYFLCAPETRRHYEDLAAAVRAGGTVTGEQGMLRPEHPLWVEFARAMAPMMRLTASLLVEKLGAAGVARWKVLDVAAGHGAFGIAIARHNPNAEIVAVDWPNVLELATENAREAGVEARYRALAGSAFEVDFGKGYDVVLLTNFLHHFDVPTCEALLRKVHAALDGGGRVATLEFVPDEDRVSPAEAAMFALTMLAATPGGDAYTFAEYERMFRRTGFTATERHPLPPTPQTLLVSRR